MSTTPRRSAAPPKDAPESGPPSFWRLYDELMKRDEAEMENQDLPSMIDDGKGNFLYNEPTRFEGKIIDLIVDKYECDWNRINQSGRFTPLILAVISGYHFLAKALIRKGAKVNATNKEGETALHFAANKGDDPCVEILLDEGADINYLSKDESGYTPLMRALARARTSTVALLCSRGANPNLPDRYGNTPLMLLSSRSDNLGSRVAKQLAKILLEHGADIKSINKDGQTALTMCQHDKLQRFLHRRASGFLE